MNLTMRLSIGLVFMAGSIISSIAQAPSKNWTGEWGTFARIPTTRRIAEHYEGAGLTVTDCANGRCHLSFVILGRRFHAGAEGELLVESDSAAVARLGPGAEGKCTLALHKTGTELPSITVKKRTGDCSYFATPGASFEHTYALRLRTLFYADEIPACFVAEGRAVVALCGSAALSAQEHNWVGLVRVVTDLGKPRLDENAERARILKSCDAAPDPETCLTRAFVKSNEELNARKDAWKASVTEPGDADEAKRAIEAIAGTYGEPGIDGLEIERVSDISIHVVVALLFGNGHQCGHEGVASYRRAGLFAELVQDDQGELCVFEVVPTATGVRLEDPTGMCRLHDCGTRGGYGAAWGTAFSSEDRVKVDSTVQKPTDDR
jgi:hypothetical protein